MSWVKWLFPVDCGRVITTELVKTKNEYSYSSSSPDWFWHIVVREHREMVFLGMRYTRRVRSDSFEISSYLIDEKRGQELIEKTAWCVEEYKRKQKKVLDKKDFEARARQAVAGRTVQR